MNAPTRLLALLLPWFAALPATFADAPEQSIAWLDDFRAARERAAASNQPLLVEFSSKSCGWCREMEKYVHVDGDVVKRVDGSFVPMQFMGGGGELKSRFSVRGTPHTLVLTPDASVLLLRIRGYQRPSLYLHALRRAQRRFEYHRADPEAFALLTEAESLWKQNKQPEPALALVDKALASLPRLVDAASLRGSIHAHAGQFDQALAAYDQATTLDPRDPWLFHERGLIHHRQGRYAKAVGDLRQSAKLQPRGATYTVTRLWAAMVLAGQRAKADVMLKQYLSKATLERSDWWNIWTARCAAGLMKPEQLLKGATRPYRKVQAHYVIAVRALADGQREVALEHLRRAAALNVANLYDTDVAKADLARLESLTPGRS